MEDEWHTFFLVKGVSNWLFFVLSSIQLRVGEKIIFFFNYRSS